MSNLQVSLRDMGEEEERHHPESVATFVTKLWSILAKPDYYHLICWSGVSEQVAVLVLTREGGIRTILYRAHLDNKALPSDYAL